MNSTDIDLTESNITDVDRAMKLLLQAAESHESGCGDYCNENRARLVAFVMYHMELELSSIGDIAEALMDIWASVPDEPETKEQWADVVGEE